MRIDKRVLYNGVLTLWFGLGISGWAQKPSSNRVETGVGPGSSSSTVGFAWSKKTDFSSYKAYNTSVATNRELLRKWYAVPERTSGSNGCFEGMQTNSGTVVLSRGVKVQAVSWPVCREVSGEGLWLRPAQAPLARVIVLADAGQSAELLCGLKVGLEPEAQYARRLAENGCEVIVMELIGRQVSEPVPGGETKAASRELLCQAERLAGQHVAGWEVSKVQAALDFFDQENRLARGPQGADPLQEPRLGVMGYGEGGLVALVAAALDLRVGAALVSGYWATDGASDAVPLYRRGLFPLSGCGAAEMGCLVAPRDLIVEHSPAPQLSGSEGSSGDGGRWIPDYAVVEQEVDRARSLVRRGEGFDRFTLICGPEGMATGPGSERALVALLKGLNVAVAELNLPEPLVGGAPGQSEGAGRQKRQFEQLMRAAQESR